MKAPSRKRIRLLLRILLGLGVIGAAALLGISAWMKAEVRERILSPESAVGLDADCILVLGAGVGDDGVPGVPLADRLEQGVALYELGASDRLLMSGDHGRKDYDEVNVMKSYAVERGVPSSAVFMDHAGFSTYESMYRARDVFRAKRILIVTQEYHLYRAIYDAQKLGLDAYGVASDSGAYRGQAYRDFRELLAQGKDFFWAAFQPKPTYLGEAIPVTGNGDWTNDR